MIRNISIYLLLCLPVSLVWATDYDKVRQLVSAGSYSQALQELDNLEENISEKPDRAKLAFIKARALTLSGALDEAISIYQSLVETFPANPEPYLNLSALYADRGDLKLARDWAVRGLRSQENFRKLFDNLTTVHGILAANAYRAALNDPSTVSTSALAISSDMVIDEPSMAEVVTSETQTDKGSLAEAEAQVRAEDRTNVEDQANLEVQSSIEAQAKEQALLESTEYEEIGAFVLTWAEDWTDQNVDGYISKYTDTYAPAGLSHLEWVEQRRVRLTNKGFIKVAVEQVNITNVDNIWQVEFWQSYESDSLKDTIKKRLRLENVLGRWLITDEQVL